MVRHWRPKVGAILSEEKVSTVSQGLALGIVAIVLTLSRTLWLKCLVLSFLMVTISCLNDAVSTDPKLASDVHSIGYKIGLYWILPLLVLCMLKDLFRPMIKKALSKLFTSYTEEVNDFFRLN